MCKANETEGRVIEDGTEGLPLGSRGEGGSRLVDRSSRIIHLGEGI